MIAAALGLVLLFVASSPAFAQQPPPPPQPFAPDWAMLAGWDVFAKKDCGKCHSVRGTGGKGGPDLGRIQTGKSFFELGAAMWNHLPRMGARMREAGVERATLTPRETSDLIAFLFTAQYFDEQGDAKAGERLFTTKACVQCHMVGGAGGRVGPELDALKRANSPVIVAAALWNHGPKMAEAMKDRGVARPQLSGKEMLDLIAYLVSASKDTGETQQVVPGTPEKGRQLFAEKKCAACHAVGGKGPRVGPDLGRAGHHVSLTEFGARMWNHAPAMAAKAQARGIDIPTLTGQEMADILAYLYTSRYFESTASASRGRELVTSKGCVTCHSVAGKGGKVAGDFARSALVGSPAALVAGMWNHSRFMEAQASRQQVSWPIVSGQELADIAMYLGSVSKGRPATPTAR